MKIGEIGALGGEAKSTGFRANPHGSAGFRKK